MSILVVDDEYDVRESLRELLEMAGHDVITAATGTEALKCIDDKSESIKLMLVDYSMPGMNGEELILRAWEKEQKPPALFLTAMAPWHTAGLLSRGVGYIRKPININLLLDMINVYTKEGTETWA